MDCIERGFTPEWCTNKPCATILTSDVGEARVLTKEIRAHHLNAVVRPLKNHLAIIADSLSSRPLIACDWAPELSLSNLQAERLGPPPCLPTEPCPFEMRRLVKFANVRDLARSPTAIRSLVRLQLNAMELHELTQAALAKGPVQAARDFLTAWPSHETPGEVRVAVLLPHGTGREAYESHALAAAAQLVEDDLSKEGLMTTARFKVEVFT